MKMYTHLNCLTRSYGEKVYICFLAISIDTSDTSSSSTIGFSIQIFQATAMIEEHPLLLLEEPDE